MKRRECRAALCLLPALLTACAPPGAEELNAGSICRRPEAEAAFGEAGPRELPASGDLRGADLRDLDLSGMASIALGETAGAAPEALLYFLADELGTGGGEDFVRDMTWYAEDVDRRTAASPAGEAEYAYFAEGGMSWAVPWVAGLYALACQVKPEVTYEEFLEAARSTTRPVSARKGGAEYPYGKVVNPAALLEALS